jgi:hypothetical protein
MEKENNKVSNQQLAAKKYIEENDIEKIVSEMLNSLVHEKAKQPVVYMIKYLAGLLNEEERKQNGLVIPDPYPKGRPIVKFPNLERTNSSCLLKKHLNKNLWNQLKYYKTKHGGNIMNIIKLGENSSEEKIGCVLTDGESLTTFKSLFGPIIAEVHKLDYELPSGISHSSNDITNLVRNNLNQAAEPFKPPHDFRLRSGNATNDSFPYFERISDRINNLKLSFSRNLQDTPFPCIMSSDKRSYVESLIIKSINSLQTDKLITEGKFFNYKENEQEIKDILREINFYESLMKNAEMQQGWPDNRQVFTNEDRSLFILINFIDHLQVVFNFSNDKFEKKEETSKSKKIYIFKNIFLIFRLYFTRKRIHKVL